MNRLTSARSAKQHESARRPSSAAAVAVIALIASVPGTALAYVGPGAGLTMLGALWAVIAAILFVLGGVLFWPIRALVRRRAAAKSKAADSGAAAQERAPEEDAAGGRLSNCTAND